jgi:hypothetical protein
MQGMAQKRGSKPADPGGRVGGRLLTPVARMVAVRPAVPLMPTTVLHGFTLRSRACSVEQG